MVTRRVVLALAAVFALTTPARAGDPDAGSLDILNGSTIVEPLKHIGWSVKTDLNVMGEPTISGHVSASGGTGNDIEVLILTESDYINWKNGHTVTPLYNSGRVTVADVNTRLPESGKYFVVLSNLFSTFTPKTVQGTLQMTWQPSAAILAQRQAAKLAVEAQQKAESNRLLRNMLLLTAASAVAGGAIAVLVMHRKTKGEPEKMKTVA